MEQKIVQDKLKTKIKIHFNPSTLLFNSEWVSCSNPNQIKRVLGFKPDHVFCISIRTNRERQEQTKKILGQMGISFEFILVDKHPISGANGCFQSHLLCIYLAKQRGYQHVLIFEDDIEFDVEKWNQLQPVSVPTEWDMLYIGYNARQGRKYTNEWLLLSWATTTHAYIIHSSMYDLILENKQGHDTIDELYAEEIHYKRQKTYGLYPLLCFQRAGKSDITLHDEDYTPILKKNAERIFSFQ